MNLGQLARAINNNNEIAKRKFEKVEQGLEEMRKNFNLYTLADDRGEVSKRGQGVFKDVFKVVQSFTVTESGASVDPTGGAFITASDFHFDLLKWTAFPPQRTPRYGVIVRDLSSEVELSNNSRPIPAGALFGNGELPFVEVAPRRFVARGGIGMTLVDNGTIDGVTAAVATDFPYTVTLVLHGFKVFLQRVERQGQ